MRWGKVLTWGCFCNIIYHVSVTSLFAYVAVLPRDPISRALSIYYFWGELFRLRSNHHASAGIQHRQPVRQLVPSSISIPIIEENIINNRQFKRRSKAQLGDGKAGEPVQGKFLYHGDEHTPPPEGVAIAFARHLPLRKGMPGPSYTWSGFAADAKSAVEVLRAGVVCPVVTERMDESLVVLADYLGVSIADVVAVLPRKVGSMRVCS